MRYQDKKLADARLKEIQSEYAPGDQIKLGDREFTVAVITKIQHDVLVVDNKTGETIIMGLPALDIAVKLPPR